jgi:hypothetical protein
VSSEVAAGLSEKKATEKRANRTPMPKASPTDPEIRRKYSNELTAIEQELETIYDDPLKVWQDIMLNPNKYLTADEARRLDDDELQ